MTVPTKPSARQTLANCRATRLAHFIPARNLPHILSDDAIRSSKDLADDAPDHFNPTDRALRGAWSRLDRGVAEVADRALG